MPVASRISLKQLVAVNLQAKKNQLGSAMLIWQSSKNIKKKMACMTLYPHVGNIVFSFKSLGSYVCKNDGFKQFLPVALFCMHDPAQIWYIGLQIKKAVPNTCLI